MGGFVDNTSRRLFKCYREYRGETWELIDWDADVYNKPTAFTPAIHGLQDPTVHSSTATPGLLLKADAVTNLPVSVDFSETPEFADNLITNLNTDTVPGGVIPNAQWVAIGTPTAKSVLDVFTKVINTVHGLTTSSHAQNTDTGTTNSSFVIASSSILGKMSLAPTFGAADKTLTITNNALTNDRVATFQDASGTIAYLSDTHTQNTDTGTTSNSFGIATSSVLGKYSIAPTFGGVDKTMTFTNTALTDNRTVTFQNASGTVAYLSDIPALTTEWHILGNAGTVDGTNFLGTTDDIPLSFRVNNQKAGRIDNLTGATYNTCFGYQNQNASSGHIGNTSFGYRCLYSLTNGDYNTFGGWQGGLYNTEGIGNTGWGADAILYNVDGDYNVGVGYYAGLGRSGVSYDYTTFVGAYAGRYSLGNGNAYGGYQSGHSTSSATSLNAYNTGWGYRTLFSITTSAATNNTAVGREALYGLQALANSIGIGAYAGKWEVTAGNRLYIDSLDRGSEAVGRTNSIIYGIMDSTVTNQHLYANAHLHTMSDSLYHYFGGGDDMSIYYNGTNGYINTSLVAASDLYIACGTDKTLVLNETVWDDLRVVPGSFDRPGTSDPVIVSYTPTGAGQQTWLWEFNKNNIASFTVQLPHSYKTGTDIYCHIHWTPGLRGTAESGNTVGWKIHWTWANINSTFGAMNTLDLSDACDGTNDKHQMTSDVVIDGHTVAKGISSMLICNITRTDTGADDTWATNTPGNLPMLLEIDFHFEIDTLGSRTISSK